MSKQNENPKAGPELLTAATQILVGRSSSRLKALAEQYLIEQLEAQVINKPELEEEAPL